MTEFETKLLEVLTEIKTELQILTVEQDIRGTQRRFNELAGVYKHWENMQTVEEARLDAIGDQWFKENPDVEEFVPSDAYKQVEARQQKWSDNQDKVGATLKHMLKHGCINTSEYGEF